MKLGRPVRALISSVRFAQTVLHGPSGLAPVPSSISAGRIVVSTLAVSGVILGAFAPLANPRRACRLLARLELGRRVCGCAATAVEQHDPREILIIDAAAVLGAVADRLADDFAPPEIAL